MKDLNGPEYPPISGNKAKQLVVMLHGYGANGLDLFSLTHFFNQILQDAYFISPNAISKSPVAEQGYEWFPLENREEDYIYKGLEKAAPILEKYIEKKLKQLNLNYENLVLVGFSQGAMLAIHLATNLEQPIMGVISFAGAVIKPHKLKYRVTKSKCPILLSHGANDTVIDPLEIDKAFSVLVDNNYNPQKHLCTNLDHSIGKESIEIAQKFLSRIII